MKITILYNQVDSLTVGSPEEILADKDTIDTANDVKTALSQLGHQVDLFIVNKKSIKEIAQIKTEIFFNLAEGIENLPNTEFQVIKVLEKTNVPFTGSGSRSIQLTTNKPKTKKLFLENKLPTPNYQVFSGRQPPIIKLPLPVIVKPAATDGSVGINGHSVLTRKSEVCDQIDYIVKSYQEPALVEEFINGRELNVTVLGHEVLPISEIIFGPSFSKRFKVVDFPAKWKENSSAYKDTVGHCPAKLDPSTKNIVEKLSLAAYKITNCQNYARIDLRLDKNNHPYILEVNANPGLAPDSGVIRSAKAAGYTYHTFLQKVIDLALVRFHNVSS